MLKREVKIGGVYKAKVSGKLTDVRITGAAPSGGWYATNVATGRDVRIRGAQRLRSKVEPPNRVEAIRELRLGGKTYEEAVAAYEREQEYKRHLQQSPAERWAEENESSGYLQQPINYGGDIITRAEAWSKLLQFAIEQGHERHEAIVLADRWMQGYDYKHRKENNQ